ncbi:MAG: hypothetical protein RBR87_05410 [Bacteroidales bacterium]|jgi:hypothetical protein|nr:hypothetical protein [Bacteroidales bacterium]
MNTIFQYLISTFKLKRSSTDSTIPQTNKSAARPFVRYQFHVPGGKNFHLLPFRSKRQASLNIFKPHWNRILSKTMR